VKPATKARLLTIDSLDGRSAAARAIRDTISAIERDLGGDLTQAQSAIVARAAITSALLESMAAEWLATGQMDAAMWSTLSNLERRLYETLGLERRSRDVTPSLDEIAAEIQASKNEE